MNVQEGRETANEAVKERSWRMASTFFALLSGTSAGVASAQQPISVRPIIVTGERLLIGTPPERRLNEDDISAYGAGTVGELLDEIATENGDEPGGPVTLINGEPVAGIDDIREYPPEAVSAVEVLPQGSATAIGGSANRRVYNIVLKRSADLKVGQAAIRVATDGGWGSRRANLTVTRIKASRRLNASVRVRDEGALLESKRDVIQPPGSPPELGRFRTLQPWTRGYQLSVSGADQLAPWLTGSLTVKLADTRRRSLLGLAAAGPNPLRRRARTFAQNLDLSLNADVGSWFANLLGTYALDRRSTLTDQIVGTPPLGTSLVRSTSRTSSFATDLTASGPLFDLPAGRSRLTLGLALGREAISSDTADDRFARSTRSVSAGIDLPIANRDRHILPALGKLSASIQVRRTHGSGMGVLSNQTYALTWEPAPRVRLFGSVTTGRTPPDVALIADPPLETPGIRYFDPLRNETVDVTEISGGNPDLEPSRSANRLLSANFKPYDAWPLRLTVEYSANRNRDLVTAFPPASDLILQAFPQRFVRDPGGVLTIVDVRPIQFARENQERLRFGFNLTLPLRDARGSAGRGDGRGGEPAVRDEDEDTKSFSAESSPPNGETSAKPRLQINLSHSWLLKSELEIRPGIDPIDLLSKGSIGLGGASRPRHQLDFSIGYAERGLGVRITGQYRSKSYLRLVGDGETNVLRFSPLTTLNLRAFAVPGRFAPKAEWLKGSRIALTMLNLTNSRQRVRDSAGVTPLPYQPAYRDPLGRTIELAFRKAF